MASKAKFVDEGIGSSNTGNFDFLGDAAVVDDALMAKLERAKRDTESELRNRIDGLLNAFVESGRNELMFDRLPSFLLAPAKDEDGNEIPGGDMVPLTVEHGRSKNSPITLKSAYSAARSLIILSDSIKSDEHKRAYSSANVKAVWSEKAQVFALQRTDTDFEPTLKGRKTKDDATDIDTDADNGEDTDSE